MAASTSQGWLLYLLVAGLGLALGSFLNVVIYRLPVMLDRIWTREARAQLDLPADMPGASFNLVVPRSRCPSCKALIRAWQNIPVVSYLVLRGRCHHCGAPISARYPLVELLTAALTVAVVAKLGLDWLCLAALVGTWLLIALAFIDLDTQLLPDNLTLPLLWLGLLINVPGVTRGFTTLHAAVIGAVAGYLALWSVYWAFKLVTGKEGMGHGDFKLLAALGAWFGWQAVPGIILLSSVAGVAIGGTLILLGRNDRAQPIPYGPFLAIAGWFTLVFREELLSLYFS